MTGVFAVSDRINLQIVSTCDDPGRINQQRFPAFLYRCWFQEISVDGQMQHTGLIKPFPRDPTTFWEC